jgi:hypothetical protein
MKSLLFSFYCCLLIGIHSSCAQTNRIPAPATNVITGAQRTEVYLPMLKGKTVGVFANQTSMIGQNAPGRQFDTPRHKSGKNIRPRTWISWKS